MNERPPMAGLHHFSPTVTDIEASVSWYQRVLGLERLPGKFPHYGNAEAGYGVILVDFDANIVIVLEHHEANDGKPFSETRTGLDHIGIAVPSHADLKSWAEWLDDLAVPHSGVIDVDGALKYSTLVFRDPDNIQLEFFFMGG